MSKLDLTDRAVSGGWVLPSGWTVSADAYPDELINDPAREYDCYTAAQVAAYHAGDWEFVTVSVWVEDNAGREWGRAVIGSVEAGTFTMTEEDDTVTGQTFIDPLDDNPGEYSVIREHDMIGEALRDAVSELERFGTPVLVEPTGTNYSGL
jgi:hypothetical protein